MDQPVLISGMQQVGVGVPDLENAWRFYRRAFGMDIPVLRDAAEAPAMRACTGGRVERRDAVIAINDRGGGGLEIWQYTSRLCAPPEEPMAVGDLGINAVRLGTPDVDATAKHIAGQGIAEVTGPFRDPAGRRYVFVKDLLGLTFQMVERNVWFRERPFHCGGVAGCMIGVLDIKRSLRLYRDLLGYDRVLYDQSGVFEDFRSMPGGSMPLRRVLLGHAQNREGPFGRLLGPSQVELVQSLNRVPRRIYEGRQWGDQGFMHVCFDVVGMDALEARFGSEGFPFVVKSDAGFEMGEAAGRFAYVEDEDGTLIELVETRKIPIVKAIGWSLNLFARDRRKPIPDWMLKALALGRVRDGI